ncbi:General negative regulator of transcription subunit 1 [Candida tropicalis]
MVLCSGRKLLAETIEATMLQLLGNNPNEIPIIELNNAIQANVGLCVDIVDRIAAENISEIIDEKMQKYVFLREQHNAIHPNEPFIEEGATEYSLRLPDPLGLAVNGLSGQQLRIYDHFGETRVDDGIPAPAPPGSIPTQPQAQPQHPQAQQLPLTQQQQPQQPQLQQDLQQGIPEDVISFEQLFAAITSNCDKAIQLLAEVTETKLSDLPPNHPITAALTQALLIAQSNAIKFPELMSLGG